MKQFIMQLSKIILLLALGMSFATTSAQIRYAPLATEDYTISVQNMEQTSPKKLEFDIYLLDTDAGQSFELATIQLGFLFNSLIYTSVGGAVSVTYSNSGSGLVPAQQFTANTSLGYPVTGYPNKTLIRLVGKTPPGYGSGTIISTTGPGTLLTHYIITSTVDFAANTTPDIVFCSSAAVNPLYGTKLSAYIATVNTPLVVSPGGNAIVNSNVLLNPTTSQWTGAINSSWTDAGNWNGGIPSVSGTAIVNSTANQPEILTSVVISELTINTGAVVAINPSASLTVSNTLTNNAGNTGLLIKSNSTGTGSVIENNGVNATVERYFPGNTLDWHLVSSPVSNATANVFFGLYLQSFNELNSTYTDITNPETPLNVMEGYGLYSTTGVPNTATFEGTLNKGVITKAFTVGSAGWNLMGNPYASSINWENVTIPSGISNEVHYIDATSGADLSYVKGVGGTGSQFVPPMQGFFVKATTSGILELSNAARTHAGAYNFYKSTNPGLVILEASELGYTNQTWIHFNEQAGIEHDGVYDAYKIITASNPALPQIYSVTPAGEKLSVNGMPGTSSVPVGLFSGAPGVITIQAAQTGDFLEVSLEDTQTGTFTDLLSSSYSFDYTPGGNEQRFVLHLSSTVSIPETENAIANIYSNSRIVYVDLKGISKGDINIYTITGQLVATAKDAAGIKTFSLENTGNYIVKVVTPENTMVKKVWVQ